MPEKKVILCAHYDSTSNDAINNAPGADDNASGVAALLCIAQNLQNYMFNYTIEFIAFCGEEQGLVGSKDFIRKHSTDKILAVINMDMIGYWRQGIKYDINIISNTGSEWLAKYLHRLIKTISICLLK